MAVQLQAEIRLGRYYRKGRKLVYVVCIEGDNALVENCHARPVDEVVMPLKKLRTEYREVVRGDEDGED